MNNAKKDSKKEKEMEAVYEMLKKMDTQLKRINDSTDSGFSKMISKLHNIDKKIPEKKQH